MSANEAAGDSLENGSIGAVQATDHEDCEPTPSVNLDSVTEASSTARKNSKKSKRTKANTESASEKLKDLKLNLTEAVTSSGKIKTIDAATKKNYKFWSTQPVPQKFDVKIEENCAIEQNKSIEEIRPSPYSLPSPFEWDTLNLTDHNILVELYTLLTENYVEDDDNMFRFDYSCDFLQWALQPPEYNPEWHCGIRVKSSKSLVGFISAVPASIRVYDEQFKTVEINFLCVHKKLRSKRVAPVLIKEITRRVNLTGIFQAVFTAGIILPRPLATCRYWHRSLNPKKLVAVKFSHIGPVMTMQRTIKLYKLPNDTATPGLRPLELRDTEDACALLNLYLSKFKLAPVFEHEEFKHWFMNRKGVVQSYVVEDPVDHSITDFLSFYSLPSTITQPDTTYKKLYAAYSYYNVAVKNPLSNLMNDALILAKNDEFDVFNALDLMDNTEFLEKLKFGIGDGNLQYYLYNWKCPLMSEKEIGIVLQ